MLETFQAQLGYSFTNIDRLKVALTHRSFHFENKINSQGHFERLEFLGDAVLDLVLSEALMRLYPQADEGTLSKWRASLVNETTLSEVAKQIDLGQFLFLGRSEQMAGARPRLLASAFEAVLAAIYQDGGLENVRVVIEKIFASRLSQMDHLVEFATDFKTRLQEWAQRHFKTVPEYRLMGSAGPEHAKTFCFEVWVADQMLGQGEGSSRKAAEQSAAKSAIQKLQIQKQGDKEL